jgi:hypothetical protein
VANLLSRFRSSGPGDGERYSLEQYVHDVAFAGNVYQPTLPTTYADQPVESIETDFAGVVQGAYKRNGVIFACQTARLSVFAQATFCWQQVRSQGPGDTFTNANLAPLQSPWVNGSEGELLARMIQDVDNAGNAYIRKAPANSLSLNRLERLRPDWVDIVLAGDPGMMNMTVIGYLYYPGGRSSGRNAEPLILDEVAHWCADEETEILTGDGWKDYQSLQPGDDVLTLNHETGQSEWQQVEDKFVFPRQRRSMVSMEGSQHSSLTTENHRWPVEYRNSRSKSYGRRWVTSATIGSGDRIPIAAQCADVPTEPKYSDALVELVAWYWTEGSRITDHGRLTRRIRIGQSQIANPAKVERIRAALRALFGDARSDRTLSHSVPRWGERRDGNNVLFTLSSAAADVITAHAPGQGKIVDTGFLRSLTQAQLELFIRVSIAADGHRARLAQKDPRRAEPFALAVLLAGDAVSFRTKTSTTHFGALEMTEVRVRKDRSIYPQHDNRMEGKPGAFRIGRVDYDGHVWCPKTPNQTWLARRRGTVYFTGNSPYPDPIATYRGMSPITPVLREVTADNAATTHKGEFFNRAATPNLAIRFDPSVTVEKFEKFKSAMETEHAGLHNAWKTLYLGGGADPVTVGMSFRDMDYKAVQALGEPLALDTPVPTPSGWTTMGAITPGDVVFGRDGLPARVLGVSPVHTGRPCYRVTFSDRTSIVADAGHLWTAIDRQTAKRGEADYTTEQLADLIATSNAKDGSRMAVPPVAALKGEERDLLVDPYVFGCWLGDGQTAGAAICGAEEDLAFVAGEIEARGYTVTRWATAEDKVSVIGLPGGLLAALRALDVLGNKHIPVDYLRGSVEQRLDLLRGLMDTDGTVGHVQNEVCEFSSKWRALAEQVAELARSLGYRTSLRRRVDERSRTGEHWRLTFRADPRMVPFLLPRKADRCVTPPKIIKRSIVSVEPTLSVPVRCIAVDTADHLFLAGEGMVPTHNTRIAAAYGVPAVIAQISEGLAGSSLNTGNFSAARRLFADRTMRWLWKEACASLQRIVTVPPRTRLWWDERQISFLREDQKDAADIQATEAGTITVLVREGFTPESAVAAVMTEDWTVLEHTGALSVQLVKPSDNTNQNGAQPTNGGDNTGSGVAGNGDVTDG